MKYDFNVKRLENKIQISIDDWLYPEENVIEFHKISGKPSATGFTKALAIGSNVEGVNKDDVLLLSKVACDVALTPTAFYTSDGKRYFNIPAEQIIGTFSKGIINFSNLVLRKGYVLFERINKTQNSIISIEEKSTMMGKVVRVSEVSPFTEGDIIIVRDNVSTPVKFGDKKYFAVEEKFVVGVAGGTLSIKDVKILNEYILMKPYISPYVLNSTILETPDINYEDLDYSDINNRNLFKVYYFEEGIGINKGDILLLNRDFTNYFYYENEKYFVINDKKWISGKIIERDTLCN